MQNQILSRKAVHKTGKFLGNKIAEAVTKLNDDKIMKPELAEKVILPHKKRKEILRELDKYYKNQTL